MKARIIKYNGLYYGQACVKETKNASEWVFVTDACFTFWGAKNQIKAYQKSNNIVELEYNNKGD